MKKIILASKSPQRKKILKNLNVQFSVCPPNIREEKRSVKCSCAELATKNAVFKAKDVGSHLKNGVVIAADTLVLAKGKIIGKPKNKKDAFKILKVLTSTPQDIYTGLAVFDVQTEKLYSGVEKTRVWMEKMSHSDKKKYIGKVNTLGMAGSFDIQQWGALFVKRIDGCFYNVVGLPLFKLNKLLKKVGVSILCLLFAIIMGGCSTEYNLATGRQETLLYTSEKEVAIGSNIAKSVEKQFKESENLRMQEKVYDIGQKIAGVCDRKDISYHFKVITHEDEPDLVNAFALPGGYIYVFEELVRIATDDELACVIAHEIGHIAARHGVKRLQAQYAYLLVRLATLATDARSLGAGPDIAFTELMLGYSREDEREADSLSIRYTERAGYDSSAMITFLEKMEELDREKGPRPISQYSRTHPYVSDRVRTIKQGLYGQVDFIDYYNRDLYDTDPWK